MGRKKLTAGRDPNLPFICCICGDTARGNNFSVLSCVSCKSFFRRHGLLKLVSPQLFTLLLIIHTTQPFFSSLILFLQDKLQCKYDQNCHIDKETRSNCLRCRLKKCLTIGMDPQMIRCPPSQSLKHQHIQTRTIEHKQPKSVSTSLPTVSDTEVYFVELD